MILNRLKQFIDFKGISVSAFEHSIGMSNASFGKSLKNNGTIGADKLERILNVYPEISPTWLLTGEGNMFIGNVSQSQNGVANVLGDNHINNNLSDEIIMLIKNQTEQLNRKDEQITKQGEQLSKQLEQIDRLLTIIENLNTKY